MRNGRSKKSTSPCDGTEWGGRFINLQMSVLHKAMRAFHVKLTGCVVAALKIGETCGALGESFRHSDAMDMFAADVFMSAKLVPNLLRPNLSLFPWIKILTQYICSHPKRGSLDRISVRGSWSASALRYAADVFADTCRTLRDAYHESERIRRKYVSCSPDASRRNHVAGWRTWYAYVFSLILHERTHCLRVQVFDARVPDRVKVLDFFARRDETGKLNALPILRLATQHDLDATVPSDSFDVHVGWFLRDEAPRMSVYAFEGTFAVCVVSRASLFTLAHCPQRLCLLRNHPRTQNRFKGNAFSLLLSNSATLCSAAGMAERITADK